MSPARATSSAVERWIPWRGRRKRRRNDGRERKGRKKEGRGKEGRVRRRKEGRRRGRILSNVCLSMVQSYGHLWQLFSFPSEDKEREREWLVVGTTRC